MARNGPLWRYRCKIYRPLLALSTSAPGNAAMQQHLRLTVRLGPGTTLARSKRAVSSMLRRSST
jgi:hypothetical protein